MHHLLDFNGWEDITESQQKVLLSACVYLACKVTEQLRSMRDAFNILSILKDADVSLTALEDVSVLYVDCAPCDVLMIFVCFVGICEKQIPHHRS